MTSLNCPIPAMNYHRPPTFTTFLSPPPISLFSLSNNGPFPYYPRKRNKINCSRWKFRCSTAERSTITPSRLSSSSASDDDSVHSLLDCVIVGAGISGLCIAQALDTKHAPTKLIVTEANHRVGGNITTVERDGYLWEEGPNSFQPSDPMLTMLVDSGLMDDLVLGDPKAPRFVLWDGKLRPVPSQLTDLPFFDLMSFSGKLRAAFGAVGFRPPPPGHEESVEEFIRRNLGDEVFERLIDPFCSGVYAGDPSKLSMKAAFGKVWKLEQNGGSVIGGTSKVIWDKIRSPKTARDPRLPKPKGQTVGSFRKGLIMLPDAISKSLGSKVKLLWRLSSIIKLENGGYSLTYDTPQGLVSVQCKTLVMTVPSHVASSLLHPLSTAASNALSKFYYPPVASVTISYPREAIRAEYLIDGELKGFGQLHPRSQGLETLGTIYSSSLFPNRAPPGRILLLNYIGGASNPGILSKTESQLVEAVDRDLRKMIISYNAPDPLILGVRMWPQAIPQFLVGHLDVLDAAKTALSNGGFQGLFLGGNYVSGVALGRCVEGAYEVAAEMVGMSIFGFLVVAYYCLLGLFLGNRIAEIAVTTTFSFVALSVTFLFIRCTAIDPTDKTSFKSRKQAKKLNGWFILGQIGMRLFTRIERKILRTCIRRKYLLDPWKITTAQLEPLLPFPFVINKDGDAVSPHTQDDNDDISFCSLCDFQVKKHSKHCRTCNRCVEGFDHHCRWLNNCVGRKNYTTFILLMIFVLLMLMIEGGSAIAIFIRCFADKKGIEKELERKLFIKFPRGVLATISVLLVLMTVYSSAALGQLFFFHVVLIQKGMRTYDYILALKEETQSLELEAVEDDSDFSSDESVNFDSPEKPTFVSRFICREQIISQFQNPQRLSIRIDGETEPSTSTKKYGFRASINPWKLIHMSQEKALLAAKKARERLMGQEAVLVNDPLPLEPLPLETKSGPLMKVDRNMVASVGMGFTPLISKGGMMLPGSPGQFPSPRRRFSSPPTMFFGAVASPKHKYRNNFDLKLTDVSRELENYISRQVFCSALKKEGNDEASPR